MRFFTGTENAIFLRNPEGLCSSDEYELLVQPFMNRFFSYETTFLCLSIRGDDESGNIADAYGFQFELKPDVMDDIAIVCAGDFQNVIYDAYCGLLRGEDIARYVHGFELLPNDADRTTREKILMKALSKAKDAGRPYAEARIYRCLRRTDCIDPDAGKSESIAINCLGEDEEE